MLKRWALLVGEILGKPSDKAEREIISYADRFFPTTQRPTLDYEIWGYAVGRGLKAK
jgi:hypothetical protein